MSADIRDNMLKLGLDPLRPTKIKFLRIDFEIGSEWRLVSPFIDFKWKEFGLEVLCFGIYFVFEKWRLKTMK